LQFTARARSCAGSVRSGGQQRIQIQIGKLKFFCYCFSVMINYKQKHKGVIRDAIIGSARAHTCCPAATISFRQHMPTKNSGKNTSILHKVVMYVHGGGMSQRMSFPFISKKAVIAAALGLLNLAFVLLFIAARDLLPRCVCVHSLECGLGQTRKFSALVQLPAPGESGTHKRRIARCIMSL
jgi:hypothetical protein